MTVKLGSLKADTARERDGEWVDVPDLPGVRLKVRSFNYGPYVIAKGIVEARWARRYARDPVPPEESHRANGELYADHILLGWEGFDEPWTPETARALLLDPAYRVLHEHVRYAGIRVGTVDVEFVEDAAKN